jgi:hypothetical protein
LNGHHQVANVEQAPKKASGAEAYLVRLSKGKINHNRASYPINPRGSSHEQTIGICDRGGVGS